MMTKEEIKNKIQAGLPGAEVVVRGDDGVHFEAIIVSDSFEGKSKVQRHQMIYGALGPAMGEEIHALTMRTLTIAEFKKLTQDNPPQN